MKILIAVTSSIAAYRIPNLVSQLRKKDHEVITMVSQKAKAFVTTQALAVMSGNKCYGDEDEWTNTDEVIHIKLARWCDICVIAPLTANTLAKLAHGFCDNLITSAVRALDNKPLLIAPAMNTRMWENKITAVHLQQLANYYNLHTVGPIFKRLADGDEGMGAMAEDEMMLKAIEKTHSS